MALNSPLLVSLPANKTIPDELKLTDSRYFMFRKGNACKAEVLKNSYDQDNEPDSSVSFCV